MNRTVRVGAGAVLLLVMALFCAVRLEVSNEITHFLAPGDDPRLAKLSRRLAESELTRTMIFTVSAPDVGAAVEAADDLAATLVELEEVAWVRTGWDPAHNEAFHELYFPRRLLLLTDRPDELEAELSEEGLLEAARELKRQLSLPTAPLVKQLAGEDPLLSYARQLERLENARGGELALENDHFVTPDSDAVVFVASVHSPFESEHQRPLQEAIAQAVASAGPGVLIEQSGVGRFALQAEQDIRGDVTRISIISTIGMVLLFGIMFRTIRFVLLPLVPIAFGVAAATSVSLLMYGQIHGLTLAFGASLIGIAIDYPVHLFNHHVLDPAESGAQGTLSRIRPGLLLGASTTVVGFAGLGWTSFPGVREIALFASVGITAALLSTLWLLPALMPAKPEPIRFQRRLASLMSSLLGVLERRRALTLAAPVLAVLVLTVGVFSVEFEDDISALTPLDPDLKAQDERVRARVSRMEAGRLVVALAGDEETALVRNDEVFRRLTQAKEEGALAEFRSLHTFVWSAALQDANRRALRDDAQLQGRLERAFEAEGFRAGAFAKFADSVAEIPEEPLRFADLLDSPVGELIGSFRTEVEGEVGILTFLRGVEDPAAVAAAVDGIEGVYFFDQKATMADIYGRHRSQSLQLVLVGLLGVFLMLLARYRKPRLALAAFAPALLAGGAALAVISMMGIALNLLHVVSLLLVLSMGVDYGVFLAESHGQAEEEAATLLSLAIACLSTVCAFGLLGMSTNPALQAIGYTTGLGVLFSLVLAPTALVLFRGKASSV